MILKTCTEKFPINEQCFNITDNGKEAKETIINIFNAIQNYPHHLGLVYFRRKQQFHIAGSKDLSREDLQKCFYKYNYGQFIPNIMPNRDHLGNLLVTLKKVPELLIHNECLSAEYFCNKSLHEAVIITFNVLKRVFGNTPPILYSVEKKEFTVSVKQYTTIETIKKIIARCKNGFWKAEVIGRKGTNGDVVISLTALYD